MTTNINIAGGTRLTSPPSTGRAVDPSVGRNSNDSSGGNQDRSVQTQRDESRLEPNGIPPSRNPVNATGDEGLATSSRAPTLVTGPPPPPPQGDQGNPHNGETTQDPGHLGKKKTKAVIKLATLNIRGGGSAVTQEKWEHINQIMRDKKIAVLAVQESHLDKTAVDNLNSLFHIRLSVWNSGDPLHPSVGKGVALVLNKGLTRWREAVIRNIIPGRALLMCLPWQEDSVVNILAVYAPNMPQENAAFWSALSDKWEAGGLPIPDVMLGDFNVVEEAIDRLPPHRDNAQAVSKLVDFKSMHTLQDGWRNCNPNELAFSFTQNATQSRSRIDRIYVSSPIYKHSHNWRIDHTPIHTDHCMVSVEFANPGAPFIGKGRWSIPLYLIKHRKMLQQIESLGCQLEKDLEAASGEARTGGNNPQTLFHTFKKLLTRQVREFAKVETPKMDARITALKETL